MNKACPVVIRKNKGRFEILAFKHPLAGCQIVKGTIELGEKRELACEIELNENPLKAGIIIASMIMDMYLVFFGNH